MSENKKKTDWTVSEAVRGGGRRRPAASNAPTTTTGKLMQSPPTTDIKVQEETPEGVMVKYKQKRLSRKASVAALKLRYDSELDALKHQLTRACQVEKARADVMADEYLKELDSQHLQVLGELGLKNKETREKALLKLTDSTVERLKEVQEKDWPPTLVEETITEIFQLRKRAVAEIMNELGSADAKEE